MDYLLDAIRKDLLDPTTLIGALFYGLILIGVASILAAAIRKFARQIESRLSDVTGLRFGSALAQVLVFLLAFTFYAHLIPELRALATGLLAGVGIVSVVLGLAAQSTLGNLISGLSLILYRPIRVGDHVQLATPKGLTTAVVELVSLGYTVLRDAENDNIIVPNSVMASSVVIRLESTKQPPA